MKPTREIPLTKGYVAIVDDGDFSLVSALSWYTLDCSTTRYAARRTPWPEHRQIAMHTFLTGWDYVDHINGDGLDNRRVNLRPANHTQNMRNRGPLRTNTSGFKGVYWEPERRRWRARIKADGPYIHLGRFLTAEDAARAYDAAAQVVHGEFAHLNFPD